MEGKAEPAEVTELEVELKKVWSLADKNGDGTIDFKELAGLMRQLNGGIVPSALETAQIMEMLKKDSGVREEIIMYSEFRRAMLKWLVPASSSGGKKRAIRTGVSASADDTRKRIHSTISTFFTQFARKDDATLLSDAVMAQLRDDPSFDPSDPLGSRGGTGKSKEHLEARLKEVMTFRAKIPEMRDLLNGKDPTVWLQQCQNVFLLLSISEDFNTTSLSWAVSKEIIQVYHQVREYNIPVRLLAFVDPGLSFGPGADKVDLQRQLWSKAMDCLTQFVLGPRQPHTPPENPWHYTKLVENKAILISRAGVPGVEWIRTHMELSAFPEVRRSAAALLVALGAQHANVAQFLGVSKVAQAVVNRVNHPTVKEPVENLADLMRLLAVLCGETHDDGLVTPEHFTAIDGMAVLGLLARMMQSAQVLSSVHSGKIVKPIVDALSHLLIIPAVVKPHISIVDALVKLPSTPCLRKLMLLPDIGKECVEHLVAAGVMRMLEPVFMRVDDVAVQLSVVMLLEPIVAAGHPEVIMSIIYKLMTYVQNATVLSVRVANLIGIICDFGGRVIHELVKRNVVRQLLDALSEFNAPDDLLADMYKSTSTSLNFDLANKILVALHKVLASGPSPPSRNEIAKHFSVFAVDQLKNVLQAVLNERRKHVYKPWAYEANGAEVEDHVSRLLSAMVEAHNVLATGGDVTSRDVVNRIMGLQREYQAAKTSVASMQRAYVPATPAAAAGAGAVAPGLPPPLPLDASNSFFGSAVVPMVNVVVFPRGRPKSEARHFAAPRNATLQYVRDASSAAFGRAVNLSVEREAGVMVPLAAQHDLEAAFARMEAPPADRELRLVAEEAGYAGASGYGLVPYDSKRLGSFQDINAEFRQFRDQGMELLDLDQVQALYDYFRTDKRGVNALTLPEFLGIMRRMGVRADDEVLRRYFNALDSLHSKDGTVSIQELILGMSVLVKGSYNDKLKLAFRAFDEDGDARISYSEMVTMIRSTLGLSPEAAAVLATQMFSEFDTDRTGTLEFGEFEAVCRKNPSFLEAFFHS